MDPTTTAPAGFLGLLMLDTRFPRPPGDVGNPQTYARAGIPARFVTVRGASPRKIVQEADPAFLQPFIDAAVGLARDGAVGMLMKGSLHTDHFMSAVVARESGLRTGRRISHAFVMAAAAYPKLFLLTDAAVNIAPTLQEKADIAQNAIDLARALGVARPKVAVLCATESVNPAMPATLDAAALSKMADRQQIRGGQIDGPLAFDNAISRQAAEQKGIVSPVAGDADILLVPDIEAGNMLYKELTWLAGAATAGLVLGTRVPVLLTSRSDAVQARVDSCAVAALYARALAVGAR